MIEAVKEQKNEIVKINEKQKKLHIGSILFVLMIILGVISLCKILSGGLNKPIIELNGDKEIELSLGSKYEELGAKLYYKNEDMSDKIQITGNIDVNKVGEYVITYTLNYKKLNLQTQRIVKVIDNEPPKIVLKGESTIKLTKGEEYKEYGYIVSDNYDKKITVITKKNDIDANSYKLIYIAQDSSGNTSETERIVKINGPENTKNKSIIYLTFDDGPSSDITPKILNILKKHNIKATFFVINYSKANEKYVKRAVQEGHSVGLHGYSHDYKKIYASEEIYMNNLSSLQEKVEKSTGVKTWLTRFPGGSSNTISRFNKHIMTKLTKKVEATGYKYYDWNVTSGDAGDVKTKEEVYKWTTSGLKKNRGNVVLMHDFSGNDKTLNALEKIIKYGKKNGYEFRAITYDNDLVVHHPVNN